MDKTYIISITLILFLGNSAAAQSDIGQYEGLFDRQRLFERAEALSSDAFEGRGPGTTGERKTTAYIAEHLQTAGVSPVNGSYFQSVDLIGLRPIVATSLKILNKSGDAQSYRLGGNFVVFTGSQKNKISVKSEIMFVGYGIEAPEFDWNDYKGERADFQNKILLVLVNEPPATEKEPKLFGASALTYYGRWTYKLEEAVRRGAAGVILIHTDKSAGYPWSVVRNSAGNWHFEIVRQKVDRTPFLKIISWTTKESAEQFLKSGGLDLEELIAKAKSREFRPINTGLKARIELNSLSFRFNSQNVVGMVEGSDDKVKDEFVIFTAHWDHLGLGRPDATGDRIYNGAYDNAGGTAAVMSIAEALAKMPRQQRPRRSFLFLFTTAEEQGLIGAEYYTKNPLVGLDKTLAVLNLDGINIFGRTNNFTALGIERSTLSQYVQEVARERNLRLEPDPQADQGWYFRSDHFPFAKSGVPGLSFQHGNDFINPPGEPAMEFYLNFKDKYYHQTKDEFAAWWDISAMIQQSEIALAAGIKIANAEKFPRFNDRDEFAPADHRRFKSALTLLEKR